MDVRSWSWLPRFPGLDKGSVSVQKREDRGMKSSILKTQIKQITVLEEISNNSVE